MSDPNKKLTNIQFAETLEKLAQIYRENPDLPRLFLSPYAWSKEELLLMIHGFGGAWEKDLDSRSDYIQIRSQKFPPLTVVIPRDRVCKKIVTWDCQPLLTPEDLGELEEVSHV